MKLEYAKLLIKVQCSPFKVKRPVTWFILMNSLMEQIIKNTWKYHQVMWYLGFS